MKKILIMLVLFAYAFGGHAQTKTQVETTIDTTIVENGAGRITPTLMRFVLRQMVDYSANKSPNSHTHLSSDITDWTSAWAARFAAQSTSNLAEGSNLYFTNARVATYGDANYGRLASTNNWTGSNTFGGSTSPTHAITLPQGASWTSYNTADQTANFERVRGFWSGNTYNIQAENGGTGVYRNVTLGGLAVSLNAGVINFGNGFNSSAANGTFIATESTTRASSGITNFVGLLSTVNQSGTAGYRGIFISPFEQTAGAGAKLPLDVGINSAANGGGTHTSRFSVGSNGEVNFGTLGRMFSNGNWFLGSSPVDAGHKLDISGTARVSDVLSLATGSTKGLLYSGTKIVEAVNGGSFTQILVQPSSGNKDGVLQVAPAGTFTSSALELYNSSSFGTARNTIKNTNGIFQVLRNDVTQMQIFPSGNVHFQNGGTYTDIPSATVTINSTNQGFLPPRMTQTQRDAIASPVAGLTLYCTDCTATDVSTGVMQTYNGSTWKNNW